MGTRLTRGDREKIDDLKNQLWNFTFNLLDAEFGGEIAGAIAQQGADALEARLTAELEVSDEQPDPQPILHRHRRRRIGGEL